MLDVTTFDVLTFDCYGTLIDWESGLRQALRPIFARHGISIAEERALELFGALEPEAESGEFHDYKTVLRTVLQGMGRRLAFAPTAEEMERFPWSIENWPPFPDSSAALQALKKRYKLAVISNVDDDLFALSERRLQVAFDWVVTAQQVHSYKPSTNNFLAAFERIAVPRDRILHVAQSLYHDIAPARSLGLATVWVDRRRGKEGSGATRPARAQPDLEIPDLATLAELAVSSPAG